jgi:prevent-host-death family protein
MTTVGSSEFKTRLGKYFRLVRQGEAVQITYRGKPVGFILPAASPDAGPQTETVARLVATGFVRPARGRLPRRRKPAILAPGERVEEMIAGDRR